MKKLAFLIIPLTALFFFGCPNPNSSTDQTSLKLGETSLVFTEIGGSKLVAVSGDSNWTASSNQAWCTVSPDHGSGSGAINITADINNTIVQRTAKVTIKTTDNKLSSEIIITQAAGQPAGPVSDGHGNSIDANPALLDFLNIGGSKTIQVSSTVDWQIVSDQGWCSVSASSGNGNVQVTVTVSANTGTSSRIARLSIINSTYVLTKTVTVTQLGIEPSIVILPPTTRNIDDQTQTISVNVSANVDFDVTPNVNWITVTQVTAAAVTLQAQANPSTISRTGTVTLKQKSGSAMAVLTVVQEGKPPAVYYASSTGNDLNDGKSWNNAVKDINLAIYFAAPGDYVWVEEGAYSENVTMKDGVNVYGGFNRSDINISNRGTRRSVLTGGVFTSANNFSIPTILDGFTIFNDNLNTRQTLNKNSIINNCELEATIDGLPISWSLLTISGGIISDSSIVIKGKYSLDGTTAIYTTSGGMILNSNISNYVTNYPGYNYPVCSVTIFLNGGRVEGCIISGCTSNSIVKYSSGGNNIVNCTFNNLQGTWSTGSNIFLNGSGSLNFVNNIVLPHGHINTVTGLYEANNMQGLANDNVYLLNADWSPMPLSGAVNKGDNSFVTIDKDILGNPRIQNGRVDIGAIESSY